MQRLNVVVYTSNKHEHMNPELPIYDVSVCDFYTYANSEAGSLGNFLVLPGPISS